MPFRLVPAPARHFPQLDLHRNGVVPQRRRTADSDPSRHGEGTHCRWRSGTPRNRRGSVRLHARLFDGVQPATLVVESQWPNSRFVDGIGINTRAPSLDSPMVERLTTIPPCGWRRIARQATSREAAGGENAKPAPRECV